MDLGGRREPREPGAGVSPEGLAGASRGASLPDEGVTASGRTGLENGFQIPTKHSAIPNITKCNVEKPILINQGDPPAARRRFGRNETGSSISRSHMLYPFD
jgi:hypothetical protein